MKVLAQGDLVDMEEVGLGVGVGRWGAGVGRGFRRESNAPWVTWD